jgi:hypothetical protein
VVFASDHREFLMDLDAASYFGHETDGMQAKQLRELQWMIQGYRTNTGNSYTGCLLAIMYKDESTQSWNEVKHVTGCSMMKVNMRR